VSISARVIKTDFFFEFFDNVFLLQNQAHVDVALDAPLFSFVFTVRLLTQTFGDGPFILELG